MQTRDEVGAMAGMVLHLLLHSRGLPRARLKGRTHKAAADVQVHRCSILVRQPKRLLETVMHQAARFAS